MRFLNDSFYVSVGGFSKSSKYNIKERNRKDLHPFIQFRGIYKKKKKIVKIKLKPLKILRSFSQVGD